MRRHATSSSAAAAGGRGKQAGAVGVDVGVERRRADAAPDVDARGSALGGLTWGRMRRHDNSSAIAPSSGLCGGYEHAAGGPAVGAGRGDDSPHYAACSRTGCVMCYFTRGFFLGYGVVWFGCKFLFCLVLWIFILGEAGELVVRAVETRGNGRTTRFLLFELSISSHSRFWGWGVTGGKG